MRLATYQLSTSAVWADALFRIGAAALRSTQRGSGPAGHCRGRACLRPPGVRPAAGPGVRRSPGDRGRANALGSRAGQRGVRPNAGAYAQQSSDMAGTAGQPALDTAIGEDMTVKRIRIDRPRIRRERAWAEDMPADPRDPDVIRAKALARCPADRSSRSSRAR